MPSKQEKSQLICPCCYKIRGDRAKQLLLDIELECNRNSAKDWWSSEGWSINAAMTNSLQWACPICLKRSVAIRGKPWLQTWCDYPPYFAFFDVKLDCEDCKNQFVFSASEQQFWYEKLLFWVQSRPKQCKNCRKNGNSLYDAHQSKQNKKNQS